jgi:hypothetical protein
MARFNLNRQMALILALVATLLTSPMLTGTAFSGSIGGGGVPTPEGPGGDQKGDPKGKGEGKGEMKAEGKGEAKGEAKGEGKATGK